MGDPRFVSKEFGICQDGLDIMFEELPSGNIRLVMQGYGITELLPACYNRLALFLSLVYKETQVGRLSEQNI